MIKKAFRRDGMVAGHQEGKELGEQKGLEIGSEVGMYAGFCEVRYIFCVLVFLR